MAPSQARIAVVVAAALAVGAGAFLLLRPGRDRASDDAAGERATPGDEVPADSLPTTHGSTPGAPSPLAAGGRAPRPLKTQPAAATPDGPAPTPNLAPTPSVAPDAAPAGPATLVAPAAPDRAADGVAGVVFSAKGPVSGAVLRLRRGRWRDRTYASTPAPEPEHTVAVDSEGKFTRVGLDPGEWWAEVAIPGSLPRLVGFTVGTVGPGRAIEVGDGGVEGKLYDREGKALADARVTISRGPVDAENPSFMETRTSADGSFRFDALVEGPWWLVGFTGPDRYRGENRTERIVIVAGMTITHDLGIPRAEPTWSGVVRTRSGKPVRGGGSAAVFLIEQRISRAHGAKLDEEGRFSGRWPGGLHSVSVIYLGGAEHKPIEVGKISLDGDLQQDLTLPGSRLSGTIRPAVSGSLPGNERIYWMREGTDPSTKEAVSVAADGTYVVDGMPAGRYAITGFPQALFDARGDPPVVDMSDDRPEVTLDLVAKPP